MRDGKVRLLACRADWVGRHLHSQAWPFRRPVGTLLSVVWRALGGRLRASLFGIIRQIWPLSSNDWVVLSCWPASAF
eukprot:97482-Pyramimonas_sp.AAC.1